MNYKSGDLVTITGNCSGHWFEIGETVRLKYRVECAWAAEHLDGHDWWCVRESDMKPFKPATMPQKIVITTDGKITLARLFDGKTMVKRAEAKCAPSDTFDFGVGAELSIKRLMGGEKATTEPVKESKPEPVKLYCINGFEPFFTQGKVYEFKSGRIEMDNRKSFLYESIDDFFAHNNDFKSCLFPLVRRPAKVGEWVLITNQHGSHTPSIQNGAIQFVIKDYGDDSVATKCENVLLEDEYLVLDGYAGDPT